MSETQKAQSIIVRKEVGRCLFVNLHGNRIIFLIHNFWGGFLWAHATSASFLWETQFMETKLKYTQQSNTLLVSESCLFYFIFSRFSSTLCCTYSAGRYQPCLNFSFVCLWLILEVENSERANVQTAISCIHLHFKIIQRFTQHIQETGSKIFLHQTQCKIMYKIKVLGFGFE